jgi:hypothetical protein
MQIVRKMMKNLRKQFLTRSSFLVYVSLCLTTAGRYAFDRDPWRHTFMSAAALALTAAMMFLFIDMRKRSHACVATR